MTAAGVQRWRAGRSSYRPASEPIDPRRFEVAPIAEDSIARAFVLEHHYAGSYPAARFRFGLYRAGELAGVAVFSVPMSNAVLTRVFPGPALEKVELGRFVLLDDVGGNGETWFLARCFEALRGAGVRGVVSFSDPMPRRSSAGVMVFPGHIGTIYQAHNGRYTGRGRACLLRLLPDGRVFSPRAAAKIRAGVRGWRYAAEMLERAGASRSPASGEPEALRRWLALELPRVTRPVRHPGNHRYCWPLDRGQTVALPPLPFPKLRDLEVAS